MASPYAFARAAIVVAGTTGVLVAWHAHPFFGALQGDRLQAALAVATLAGVAVALTDALLAVASFLGKPAGPYLSLTAWIATTVAAAVMWPAALSPTARPLGALTVYLAIAAIPAAIAERADPGGMAGRVATLWRQALIAGWLAVSVFAALRWVTAIRPLIEGVDFYAYVAFARDLARGASDVTLERYHYFPGAFTFWRAAVLIGDGSLTVLQWSYLALLGANAVVAAVVVTRAVRSVAAGMVTALWYAQSCVRYEGFYGTTEPLVTLPVLLGLLVWAGAPLVGVSGLARAVVLGVGLGAGVYAKQQGSLLAAGWLFVVAANLARPRERRWPWLAVSIVPVAAVAAFVGLILVEGHGFTPIAVGWARAREYGGQSGFLEHIVALGLASSLLWPGAVAALIAWVGLTARARTRTLDDSPALAILGFAGVAGLTTAVQFAWRGYGHYVLLGAPFLAIAVVTAAVIAGRLVAENMRAPLLLRFLALGVAAAPVVAWPLSLAGAPFHPAAWRAQPDVARDIAAIRGVVRPGEDVLVLPPRRNELHLMLGTRARSYEGGYWWAPAEGMTARAVRSSRLDAVIVIHPDRLDPTDRMVCQWHACDQTAHDLPRWGFRPVIELPTMTVWRRP
jgi:hypothetical protein